MNTKNRVWIELERDSDDAVCEARAVALGRLLHKLGAAPDRVWWDSRSRRYSLTIDDAGSFVTLDDNGHWFNLDKLSA